MDSTNFTISAFSSVCVCVCVCACVRACVRACVYETILSIRILQILILPMVCSGLSNSCLSVVFTSLLRRWSCLLPLKALYSDRYYSTFSCETNYGGFDGNWRW